MKIKIVRDFKKGKEIVYEGTNPYEACHLLATSMVDDADFSIIDYEITNDTN